MLWALTRPEPEARTDLGEILPPIVFIKTIFCSELRGFAEAEVRDATSTKPVATMSFERIKVC
jgi:hypothetical protein